MTGANRHVIDQSLQILREGLMPFLRERIDAAVRDRVLDLALARELVDRPSGEWDVSVMLRVMRARWNEVCPELDRRARPLLFEAADIRNAWAHQQAFSDADTDRALDTICRLLRAVEAPQAKDIAQLRAAARGDALPTPALSPQSANSSDRRASSVRQSGATTRPLPNTEAFRQQLRTRLGRAANEGLAFLDVNAGELHRDLGGGSGRNGRMVPCCNVMHEALRLGDEVLQTSPSGLTSRLTIRYRLPR